MIWNPASLVRCSALRTLRGEDHDATPSLQCPSMCAPWVIYEVDAGNDARSRSRTNVWTSVAGIYFADPAD